MHSCLTPYGFRERKLETQKDGKEVIFHICECFAIEKGISTDVWVEGRRADEEGKGGSESSSAAFNPLTGGKIQKGNYQECLLVIQRIGKRMSYVVFVSEI